MTGMEHTIERAADVIANALHDTADADLFGGYTDTDDLNDSVLDSRYSLIAVARALAEAGLLAPAPLTEEHMLVYSPGTGTPGQHDLTPEEHRAFMEQHGTHQRRWVTDWLPVDLAEDDHGQRLVPLTDIPAVSQALSDADLTITAGQAESDGRADQ